MVSLREAGVPGEDEPHSSREESVNSSGQPRHGHGHTAAALCGDWCSHECVWLSVAALQLYIQV